MARTHYHDASEHQGHESARENTGHKQLANGLIGDSTVQNHGDGGRNQNTQGTASSHGAQHSSTVIATGQHFRDGNSANGNSTGYGRASDGSKNCTGDDSSNAQAARQMAQPFVS